MTYSISQIAGLFACRAVINNPDARVSHLLSDSRNLLYPAESLFFAINTKTGDGHDYIVQLQKAGVRSFVVERMPDCNPSGCNFLICDDSIEALQQIAAAHRGRFDIPVIGITGSNGKTVVKEWLYQLLSDRYRICRSPKSYNSQIGVPLSLWELDDSSDLGIFEAGISRPGEMSRLSRMIRPTAGIFTNLLAAHDEGFASRQQKLAEKLLLFSSCELLVYRKKYAIEDAVRKINPSVRLVSWELDSDEADISVHLKPSASGCEAQYVFGGESGSCLIPFADEASIEDALHCLAFSLAWGAGRPELSRLEHIGMRLKMLDGIRGCTLIDDSYNSDLNSVAIALDFLHANTEQTGQQRTVILSDVRPGGRIESEVYEQLALMLSSKGVSRLVGIGRGISSHADLFGCRKQFFPSTAAFLADMPDFRDEAILVKAGRSFGFEQIIAALEKKQHETVMEVNLSSLVHNYKLMRSQLRPETKTMAMIKANAYGCGDIEAAKCLTHHHCDYFGVAVTDEGVELRKAGINASIIVMNPEPSCFDRLIEYRLEPEVYSFRLLRQFAEAADRLGASRYPIHIKLDTGMHRLGFLPSEVDSLAAELSGFRSLSVASAFSHLATADDPAGDDFTLAQIRQFEDATARLKELLGYGFIRHILNTAGIWRFPEHQLDMVRMGIGLYGVAPDDKTDIRNIASLKTIILQIKDVKKDETIGYNRRGTLDRDSRIAAIPIGYADGLDRAFGNRRGYALVKGQKAPFIGNICMDVCMIDVTDIADASEGDEVIIFGDDLPISRLAAELGTIPYEILTKVSARVKRVYYNE